MLEITTYKKFIERLSARMGVGVWQPQARKMADSVFATLAEELVEGNSVFIPGVGRFYAKISDAREFKSNLPTAASESVKKIPAHIRYVFKMSPELKAKARKVQP